METGQPWGETMSYFLRPMETTQNTAIVTCKKWGESTEPDVSQGLESYGCILQPCIGKKHVEMYFHNSNQKAMGEDCQVHRC